MLKLPTGKEDPNYNLDQIFANLSNPLSWPLLPFVIVLDIFAAFFNCTSQTLAPANLASAFLVLNVSQNTGGAALSQITIQHAAKPWWQTVSWTQAFPFSGAGTWAQAGGDLDATFTPIAGVSATDTDGSPLIKFDVTAYFKTLLQNQNLPHYGFIMRSAGGAALSPVVLNSVQLGNQLAQPRLVSTYNCIAPVSSLQSGQAGQSPGLALTQPEAKPYTYYLGQPRR